LLILSEIKIRIKIKIKKSEKGKRINFSPSRLKLIDRTNA